MKTTTSLTIAIITLFLFSCEKDNTDIDGNTFSIIKIGEQLWMAENLKVTHYNDGTPIPNVMDDNEWTSLTTGAYCNYENDEGNVSLYGRLYNWYAVNSGKLCPKGWHVPSDDEWKNLEIYLGMSQSDANSEGWRGTYEGEKLKSTSGWYSGGNGTNESGFSALPSGARGLTGNFHLMGELTYFWSATEYINYSDAWYRQLYSSSLRIRRNYFGMDYGFCVRCIKD